MMQWTGNNGVQVTIVWVCIGNESIHITGVGVSTGNRGHR